MFGPVGLDTIVAIEVLLKRESSALFTDFIAETDLVIGLTVLTTEATIVFLKYQIISEVPIWVCLYPFAVILHAGLSSGVSESTFF